MDIETFALLAPCVLLSLTVHELAHAVVATRLGDPTARREGRLTLNPIKHVDPLGALMFTLTALIANLPFGWAKPVPVVPGYFRRPKEGMALVAAAGPASNFLLALVALAIFRHAGLDGRAEEVVRLAYLVNVVLGIFNLIPVPPLDGSRILGIVLPDRAYVRWMQFDQYGMLVVLGLYVVFRDHFTDALDWALRGVTSGLDAMIGG